jgi:hypothetical protein
MQGMQGEQSGDKSALPYFFGHAAEEPEEKQSAQDMEDKIGYMISSGIQTIDLVIEYQRKPDQRIPQAGIYLAEHPAEYFRCKSGLQMSVFSYINLIVIIDEVKLTNLPVDGKRSQYQNDINEQLYFAWTDIYFIYHSLYKARLNSRESFL